MGRYLHLRILYVFVAECLVKCCTCISISDEECSTDLESYV